MLQGDELMFIDLSCAGTGHPIFDMMSMYLCTVCHLGRQFETFTDEEALKIWKIFLSSYLQTEDADFLLRAEEQIEAFSSARFLLGLLNIPDLIPPEAVAGYKAKVFAYYDKGLEPLCF